MPYPIKCSTHGESGASNILDLIENNTDHTFGRNGGTIVCPTCKQPATIFRSYELQEKGQRWECWIKQVARIPSEDIETYVPYVLFTTGAEAGKQSDGMMVGYYKDTRGEGGRLKHGHGPGGPAVLGRSELLLLIRYVVKAKLISAAEIQEALAGTSYDPS